MHPSQLGATSVGSNVNILKVFVIKVDSKKHLIHKNFKKSLRYDVFKYCIP